MNITLIGENCDDIFVYGDASRICPEAPVPVFIPKYTKNNIGMLGNVSNNLKSISPNVIINVITQNNQIIKKRFIDEKTNQMLLRIDTGDNDTKPLILNDNHINMIKNNDVTIVSDYNKGFLSDETLFNIAQNSKLSFIDTKRKIKKKIAESFSFIKVNETEYNKNKKILRMFHDKVIVTLGKNGAKYINQIFPSNNPKDTIDVSGAGDTFLASFVLYYWDNNDIYNAIKFANEMSSIVVSKRGVVTPF